MIASLIAISSLNATPVESANELLTALTPKSRTAALMPFEDDYRTLFRFVPAERLGAFVRDFSAEAQSKANAFLGDHLSPDGMKQVETIRKLEDILKAQENNNPVRDSSLYAFTFFGKPLETGMWGWRYEGHHISLNYTYKDGKMISSSPQFMGSNPAEVRSGPMKGTRVLAEESDLAFELLHSLSESQRKIAILGDRTLRDINSAAGFATNNDRVAKIDSKSGLSYEAMNSSQKVALKNLVSAHANVQKESEVRRRMAKIEKAGWNGVVFAWMGSTQPTSNHYYRVQGPTFLIEFDNAQGNTNHIHSVWRDFNGDFGTDVLAEHYANSPHHHRK